MHIQTHFVRAAARRKSADSNSFLLYACTTVGSRTSAITNGKCQEQIPYRVHRTKLSGTSANSPPLDLHPITRPQCRRSDPSDVGCTLRLEAYIAHRTVNPCIRRLLIVFVRIHRPLVSYTATTPNRLNRSTPKAPQNAPFLSLSSLPAGDLDPVHDSVAWDISSPGPTCLRHLQCTPSPDPGSCQRLWEVAWWWCLHSLRPLGWLLAVRICRT